MRYAAYKNNVVPLFGAAPVVSVTTSPIAGYYYLPSKGDTPWSISKKAYKDTGLATVKTGLMLMNDNAANDHIKKATTGWESYGVKGLQLNPKYDSTDAQSEHGSGTGYPLVWIPPLSGATPDQVASGGAAGQKGETGSQGAQGAQGPKGDTGAQGPKGDTGAQGPKGDTGAAGHTPTTAELKSLISDFMDENPVATSVSSADLAKAVAAWLAENPIAQGVQGPQGKQGPQGAQGPAGPAGAAGRAPTSAEISSAVSTYMKANPVSAGTSTGIDLDQARDFVDARIRVAMRNLPTTTTTSAASGDFDLSNMTGKHAILFLMGGILGAAILNGMQSMKRSRRHKALLAGRDSELKRLV